MCGSYFYERKTTMSFGTTMAKIGKKLTPHVPDILTATA